MMCLKETDCFVEQNHQLVYTERRVFQIENGDVLSLFLE